MGRLQPVELLGITAGVLTTGAYVPQLLSVWRARSGRGLTYSMLAIFNTGVCLWIVYGRLIHSSAVLLTNACTIVLSGAILALKITFDQRDRRSLPARGQAA